MAEKPAGTEQLLEKGAACSTPPRFGSFQCLQRVPAFHWPAALLYSGGAAPAGTEPLLEKGSGGEDLENGEERSGGGWRGLLRGYAILREALGAHWLRAPPGGRW